MSAKFNKQTAYKNSVLVCALWAGFNLGISLSHAEVIPETELALQNATTLSPASNNAGVITENATIASPALAPVTSPVTTFAPTVAPQPANNATPTVNMIQQVASSPTQTNTNSAEAQLPSNANRIKKDRFDAEYKSEDALKSTLEEGRLRDEQERLKKISTLNLELLPKGEPQVVTPVDESYKLTKSESPASSVANADRNTAKDPDEHQSILIDSAPVAHDSDFSSEAQEVSNQVSAKANVSDDEHSLVSILGGKSLYLQDFRTVWNGVTYVRSNFSEHFSVQATFDVPIYKRLNLELSASLAKADYQIIDEYLVNAYIRFPYMISNIQNFGVVNYENTRIQLSANFVYFFRPTKSRVSPYLGVGPELIVDNYASLVGQSYANFNLTPNTYFPSTLAQNATTAKFSGNGSAGVLINISNEIAVNLKTTYRYIISGQQATSALGDFLINQEPRNVLSFMAGITLHL